MWYFLQMCGFLTGLTVQIVSNTFLVNQEFMYIHKELQEKYFKSYQFKTHTVSQPVCMDYVRQCVWASTWTRIAPYHKSSSLVMKHLHVSTLQGTRSRCLQKKSAWYFSKMIIWSRRILSIFGTDTSSVENRTFFTQPLVR